MSTLAAAVLLGHEQVSFHQEPDADYTAIVAIHSSVLGPAVGGTRLLSYPSLDDALLDALRLSRGMTYKNAAAGLPLGGAKAVILGDSRRPDRERVFRAHGRTVERFGGRFITAEDVGTSAEDVAIIGRETRHVRGFGDLGAPSPWTARGVCRAIQAAAHERWGSDSLAGRTVALQGCGQVGARLAGLLAAAGARLLVSDTEPRLVEAVVRELDATVVEPAAIYDARADVFAPCALGAVLDDRTIPRLRVEIVAGAANNRCSATAMAICSRSAASSTLPISSPTPAASSARPPACWAGSAPASSSKSTASTTRFWRSSSAPAATGCRRPRPPTGSRKPVWRRVVAGRGR